jgi:multidrug resistance protein, MATE family
MMLGLAVLMLRTQPLYAPLALFKAMERPDWPLIGRFARVGLPGGLAYLVEITSFTLMALFIARMGVLPSAAHQIASNVVGCMFMAPLSLGVAYSARCSYWMGAGQPDLATRVARMGIATTFVWCTCIALLCAAFATPLASLYSPNPAVVALGASLLVLTALYHAADGTQTICAFLLRSWRVTLMPLLVYTVLLWGVGLWGGYVLAYQGIGSIAAMHAPQAFWIAGTGAIAAVAMVFLAIFVFATRKAPEIYKK